MSSTVSQPSVPLACVLGDPIAQSLSPRLHLAALAGSGLAGDYLAFRTSSPQLADVLRALQILGFKGANLTAPLKVEVLPLLDRVTEEVQSIGAANTVLFSQGSMVGYNTDARGLLEALRTVVGFEPSGQRVLILGAGGAARAAVFAMLTAGAGEVWLANRSTVRAQVLVQSFAGPIRICEDTRDLSVDLVINGTVVGMKGAGVEGHVPIDLAGLKGSPVVYDMVYEPTTTPLMQAARRLGMHAFDGRSMLAAQARIAFELFYGVLPDLTVLMDALHSGVPA
ncbi:shikimate dehydrogenase [Ferrimicrobium sp.]|uniref:shikimate dehydrogenase n=1 Tax=Ferrimicrobium sp. TaxID=2926050 RepID=UPI002620A93D|nr:shikimate dehydrogenase [Ferrimicrobium sp.]